MNMIRLISGAALLLLFAALTGCTEIRTKEPFGETHSLGGANDSNLGGTWYSPTTDRERWNKFVVTLSDDRSAGAMVMENAEGKSLTYELMVRSLRFLERDEVIIFYRPVNHPDEGWQFCWIGMGFNTMGKQGSGRDFTLVLYMPDEKTFTKLGLKTEKRKVATPPFGIPQKEHKNDGPIVIEKVTVTKIMPSGDKATEEIAPKKDAKDYESYEVAMLTESPDEIAAKIKAVDSRTLMITTFPVVLIRHDLMKLTAKTPETVKPK